MQYILSDNLDRGIAHVLQRIDDDFHPVIYINGTLPSKLYSLVKKGEYKFKDDDSKMKQFNYFNFNNIGDVASFLDAHQDVTVVVEDFNQLIELSSLEYAKANELIIEVLLRLGPKSFIIDTVSNRYVQLYCQHSTVV